MLTAAQSIVRYDRGVAIPDRLTRVTHRHYLTYAERMLAVYASGVGRPRRELHQSVGAVLAGEPDCDRRRIAAFCKLLDDAGEFDTDRRGEAAALRLRVFSVAAPHHPLVSEPDQVFERGEREVKGRIAAEIGRPWQEIDAALYSDVLDRQALRRFAGYASPAALLSRYNVAQVQACLYRAERVVVVAASDFKAILRHAKLARLLHDIRRLGDAVGGSARGEGHGDGDDDGNRGARYAIELAGPASVLHETRRYGIAFARFATGLLACRDWEMQGIVRGPFGQRTTLALSGRDGLSSHLPPPPEFDSGVEAAFARDFGEVRDGWRLVREGALLDDGQAVFVPDFVLRREGCPSGPADVSREEVLLEIAGFWTPEYWRRKRETLRRFRGRRMLVAVPKRLVRRGSDVPPEWIVYGAKLSPAAVIEALNRSRTPPA
jgi:predicted nuclease of restriction endonuclease-like RecB superfamily